MEAKVTAPQALILPLSLLQISILGKILFLKD